MVIETLREKNKKKENKYHINNCVMYGCTKGGTQWTSKESEIISLL